MDTPAIADEGLLESMKLILVVQCVSCSMAVHNWVFMLIQQLFLRSSFQIPKSRRRIWSTNDDQIQEEGRKESTDGHQLFQFYD